MAERRYGQFNSWEIISDDIAQKTCDKTFFYAKESGVPQSIRWFFRADSISIGRELELVLVYNDVEYNGYIKRTFTDADRTTIYWDAELSKEFRTFYDEKKPPVLEFYRLGDRRYRIRMITSSEANKEYDFNKVVTFLINYSGKQFVEPEKAGSQATLMILLEKEAKEAIQVLESFGKELESSGCGMAFGYALSWLSETQSVTDCISVSMENDDLKGSEYNIDISIRKKNKSYSLYLSVPINPKKYYLSRLVEFLNNCLSDDMYFEVCSEDQSFYQFEHSFTYREPVLSSIINVEDQAQKFYVSIDIIKELSKETHYSKETLYRAIGLVKDLKDLCDELFQLNSWWPDLLEYDPGLSEETYNSLFKDEAIIKPSWLKALYELYMMPDHVGSCKQLADQYHHAPSRYISYFSSAGARIMKQTGVPGPEDDENAKYWPVLFQGRNTKNDSNVGYCYRMREPVIEAIESLIKEGVFDSKEEMAMSSTVQFDHNLILYGPPGTGKTYNSVIYAVAICEGKELDEVKKEPYSDVLNHYKELKEDGRIAFTTFHQSYGYEEFIEGIKPKLDSDSDSIGYIIEDGIFKKFCKRACNIKVQSYGTANMKEYPRIWGMILGGSGMTELKKQCFEQDEIRLGWSEVEDEEVDGDFIGDANVSWQGKHMVYDFKNNMEIGDLVVIEKNNTSIDAIGVITGEYVYDQSRGKYPRSRSVEWLVKEIDQDMLPFLPNGRKKLSRFSLFAFDYIGMDAISQILNEYMSEPMMEVEKESKPYVFIIDEINRGNISKIFGELITLIEDTKRSGASEAMEAILPYSGESFSVPSNVYILGTMNTADRSIALMDTALRRRFKFKEMMPNSEVLESLGVGTIAVDSEELNVARMLDVINERIEYLFDREHTIGHAFFTKLADDPSLETLAGIFEKKVIPLLQEYFYEDYEKIQLVLGDNTKDDEYKFILDRSVKVKEIFNGNPDIDLPEKGYIIQRDAFRKLESYKQIGKDL